MLTALQLQTALRAHLGLFVIRQQQTPCSRQLALKQLQPRRCDALTCVASPVSENGGVAAAPEATQDSQESRMNKGHDNLCTSLASEEPHMLPASARFTQLNTCCLHQRISLNSTSAACISALRSTQSHLHSRERCGAWAALLCHHRGCHPCPNCPHCPAGTAHQREQGGQHQNTCSKLDGPSS